MIIAMGVFVSWKLTIITLLPLPLLVVLANRLGNRVHVAYGRAQQAFGQLNNKTQESITGIKVVQALGEEEAGRLSPLCSTRPSHKPQGLFLGCPF